MNPNLPSWFCRAVQRGYIFLKRVWFPRQRFTPASIAGGTNPFTFTLTPHQQRACILISHHSPPELRRSSLIPTFFASSRAFTICHHFPSQTDTIPLTLEAKVQLVNGRRSRGRFICLDTLCRFVIVLILAVVVIFIVVVVIVRNLILFMRKVVNISPTRG